MTRPHHTMQTDRLSVARRGPTLDRMGLVHVLIRVGVVLTMAGPMTPRQMTALQMESNALWSEYGVRLIWLDHENDCQVAPLVDGEPIDLWLRVEATDSLLGTGISPYRQPLGFVQFIEGAPGHTVYLRYDALSRLVNESSVGGWDVRHLPTPMRDQLIGRALGRVLAHELGHVLLETRSHEFGGLMRANFGPAELLPASRDHLGLNRKAVTLLSTKRH